MPSVRVDKDSFSFNGYGHGIASSDTLRIFNVSNLPVTYKMKTTNTKHFAVRPNLAVIESGMCTDVTVVHNSRSEIPVGLSKDKFLLEVASVPEAEGSPAFSATHFWDARKKALTEGSRRDRDVAAGAVNVDAYHFRVKFKDSSDMTANRNNGRAAESSDKSTALTTQSSWTPHIRATKHNSRTRRRNRSCAPQSKRASSIGVRTAKSRYSHRSQQIEYLDPDLDEPDSNRSTGSTPTPGAPYSQNDPVLEGASRRRSSGKKSGIVPPQTSPAESPKDTDSPPHKSAVESLQDKEEESGLPVEAIHEILSDKKQLEEEDTLELRRGATAEEAVEAIKEMDEEGGDPEFIIISKRKEDSEGKKSEKKESDEKEIEKHESEKVSDEKEDEWVESEKKDTLSKGSDKVDAPPVITVIVQKESSDSGTSTRSGKATPDHNGSVSDKENTVPSAGTASPQRSDESDGSQKTVEKTSSSKSTSEKRSDSKRTGSPNSSDSEDDEKGLLERTIAKGRELIEKIEEKIEEKLKSSDDESKDNDKDGGGGRASSDKSDEVEENLKKVAQALANSSGNDDDKHSSSSSSSSDDEDSKTKALAIVVKELLKSSSSSSSSETLHNGELAPTPPNERPTPAQFVNSRYGTEPSERSISELNGSEGKSAMTGTVMTGHIKSEKNSSNHFHHSNDGDSVSFGDLSGTVSTAPSGHHSDNRTYMNDSRSDSSFMRVGRRDFDDQFRRRRPPGPPGPWPLPGNPHIDAERRFMGFPPRPSPFDRESRDIRDDFPNGDYRPAPSLREKSYSDVRFVDTVRPPLYPPVINAPTLLEMQEHVNRYGRMMETPYNSRRQFDDDELTMYQAPRPHRRRRRKKKVPPPPPPPPEQRNSSSSSSDDVPVVRLPPKKVSDRRPTPMPSPSNSPPDESATIIATVPGAKTNEEARKTVEKAFGKVKVRMDVESDAGSDVSVAGSDSGPSRAKAAIRSSGKKIVLMPNSPLHSDVEEQNKTEQLRKLNAWIEEATANLDRLRDELATVASGEVVKQRKKSRRKRRLNPEDLDD